MLKAVGAVQARTETQNTSEPRRAVLLPKRFNYTRDDLLRLYKESPSPAVLEATAPGLLCHGQTPVLSSTTPFLQPLGDNPCVRTYSRRLDAGLEGGQREMQSLEEKPLRVVLSSASRNVPSDIQLSGSHLVGTGETGRPKLNPDAQPWIGSGLDPHLPRYHVSVLQDKVQRGDPFASILLESGLVDSCGFMSQPPTSQAYEKVWFYKDPQGLTQGPFTSVEMFNWHAAGYFTLNLQVALGGRTHFSPLMQYFRRARLELKEVAGEL